MALVVKICYFIFIKENSSEISVNLEATDIIESTDLNRAGVAQYGV
jgi:hypothetical protein